MNRRIALAVLTGAPLAACSVGALPPPQASLSNIQAARRGDLPRLAVGAFTPGPGAPTSMDRRIVIRAGSQAAPKSSQRSFARYLGDTLATELDNAGKLDPASPLVVSGVITRAHVDSGVPTGRADLTVRFTLKRAGTVVFEKDVAAHSEWSGTLIGAVAIPDAFNHYLALFPEVVGRLIADPTFRAAAAVRSRELVAGWGYEPSVAAFVQAVREAAAR